MTDPWTGTTGWGLTVGVEGGLDGERQMGKNWNCNRVTVAYLIKEKVSALVSDWSIFMQIRNTNLQFDWSK